MTSSYKMSDDFLFIYSKDKLAKQHFIGSTKIVLLLDTQGAFST